MEKGQGGPLIELWGNRRVVIDGCDGVVDYNEDQVVIRSGKLTLVFEGQGLRLKKLTESSAVIEGRLQQVSYHYGQWLVSSDPVGKG